MTFLAVRGAAGYANGLRYSHRHGGASPATDRFFANKFAPTVKNASCLMPSRAVESLSLYGKKRPPRLNPTKNAAFIGIPPTNTFIIRTHWAFSAPHEGDECHVTQTKLACDATKG